MGKTELKVEIDADLLAQARASGVDLDAVTEAAVREALTVEFAGEEFIVLVGELGAVDSGLLRSPAGDLQVYEDQIRRALDRLFTGF